MSGQQESMESHLKSRNMEVWCCMWDSTSSFTVVGNRENPSRFNMHEIMILNQKSQASKVFYRVIVREVQDSANVCQAKKEAKDLKNLLRLISVSKSHSHEWQERSITNDLFYISQIEQVLKQSSLFYLLYLFPFTQRSDF